MKTTFMANPNTIERKWYVVDAEGGSTSGSTTPGSSSSNQSNNEYVSTGPATGQNDPSFNVVAPSGSTSQSSSGSSSNYVNGLLKAGLTTGPRP